ncbi:MAG TPA: diguanylate cyclase [Phycisphaerales bacterium]|nr:diguanylate cyclase [Phycisphaerales bacterium]
MTAPATPDAGATQERAHPRVLLIDDAPEIHRLLRVRFKHDEFDIISALTADEGIRLALAEKPDLILLDIALPDESEGLHLLRLLKEEPATSDVPVIMLSAASSSRHKVTAFDLGAADYVAKPFELVELRVRIRAALRVKQLVAMLAQRAQLDGLTGLWNRAFFDQRWEQEHARSQRHGHPLCVTLLDLDHFKRVNDHHGHPVGDEVLVAVARALQAQCRQSDLACRYGGEEFAVLMPDTNAADGAVLAERIRVAVSELRWPRVPDLRATCSLGVAGSSAPNSPPPAQWIEMADRNLYAAKRAGRNRVVSTDITPATAARKSA